MKLHPSGWTTSVIALRRGEIAIGSMFNTDVHYSEVPALGSKAEEGFLYREGLALVAGAKHPEAAKKFIEFVLSREGQALVSPEGFMYAVNPDAPASGLEGAPIPKITIKFNPNIGSDVVGWLDRWRREVKPG